MLHWLSSFNKSNAQFEHKQMNELKKNCKKINFKNQTIK